MLGRGGGGGQGRSNDHWRDYVTVTCQLIVFARSCVCVCVYVYVRAWSVCLCLSIIPTIHVRTSSGKQTGRMETHDNNKKRKRNIVLKNPHHVGTMALVCSLLVVVSDIRASI